jgi:hypothetical protein
VSSGSQREGSAVVGLIQVQVITEEATREPRVVVRLNAAFRHQPLLLLHGTEDRDDADLGESAADLGRARRSEPTVLDESEQRTFVAVAIVRRWPSSDERVAAGEAHAKCRGSFDKLVVNVFVNEAALLGTKRPGRAGSLCADPSPVRVAAVRLA